MTSFTSSRSKRFIIVIGVLVLITTVLLMACMFAPKTPSIKDGNLEVYNLSNLNESASHPYVTLTKPPLEEDPIQSERQTIVVRDFMQTTSKSYGKNRIPRYQGYQDPLQSTQSREHLWRHHPSSNDRLPRPGSTVNREVQFDDDHSNNEFPKRTFPRQTQDRNSWFIPRVRVLYKETQGKNENSEEHQKKKKKPLYCECTDKEHEIFQEVKPLENGYIPILDPRIDIEVDHQLHRKMCKKEKNHDTGIERDDEVQKSLMRDHKKEGLRRLISWNQGRKESQEQKKPEVRING